MQLFFRTKDLFKGKVMNTENNQKLSGEIGQHTPTLNNPTSTTPQDKLVDVVDNLKTLEIQIKCTLDKHQYIRECIKTVEIKASFFLIIALGIFTYLNLQVYMKYSLHNTANWALPDYWTLYKVIYIISLISSLVSIIFCLMVMMPNFKKSTSSSTFFNEIAKYRSQQEYVSDVLTKTTNKLYEQNLNHAYDLAKVFSRKHDALRWGLWSATLAICLIAIKELLKFY